MRTHGQELEGLPDPVFSLVSSRTRFARALHHNTSHYITSHAYTHTHALCSNFDKVRVIDLTPSK